MEDRLQAAPRPRLVRHRICAAAAEARRFGHERSAEAGIAGPGRDQRDIDHDAARVQRIALAALALQLGRHERLGGVHRRLGRVAAGADRRESTLGRDRAGRLEIAPEQAFGLSPADRDRLAVVRGVAHEPDGQYVGTGRQVRRQIPGDEPRVRDLGRDGPDRGPRHRVGGNAEHRRCAAAPGQGVRGPRRPGLAAGRRDPGGGLGERELRQAAGEHEDGDEQTAHEKTPVDGRGSARIRTKSIIS